MLSENRSFVHMSATQMLNDTKYIQMPAFISSVLAIISPPIHSIFHPNLTILTCPQMTYSFPNFCVALFSLSDTLSLSLPHESTQDSGVARTSEVWSLIERTPKTAVLIANSSWTLPLWQSPWYVLDMHYLVTLCIVLGSKLLEGLQSKDKSSLCLKH